MMVGQLQTGQVFSFLQSNSGKRYIVTVKTWMRVFYRLVDSSNRPYGEQFNVHNTDFKAVKVWKY